MLFISLSEAKNAYFMSGKAFKHDRSFILYDVKYVRTLHHI